MTEELYIKLLGESRVFCRMIPVDYRDFLHDVICGNSVNEKNYSGLFYQKRRDILNTPKTLPLDAIPVKCLTYYKWCNSCNDYFPESEFYGVNIGEYTRNICKLCHNKRNEGRKRGIGNSNSSKHSQKKRRQKMENGYIIDLLIKNGRIKENITEEMIDVKRKSIISKRLKRAEKILYSP